jgi:Dolichyl-phosphate-mannose-protein mannosyltransferase
MTDSTLGRSTTYVCQVWIGEYYRLAVLLFVLNAISALLFILFINHMAYDDQYNLADVHRYASEGLSADSIKAHINPAGPTGFVWMAVAVRLFPANELRSARAAILISWLLLGAAILIGARHARFASLWYAALFVTLVFPHAVTAAALILTEGPALLFAILGTLLWVEFLSQPTFNLNQEPLGIAAGFSVGLAITCRQYYLALLPAAVLFVVHQWRQRSLRASSVWVLPTILSFLAAILPVVLLVFVWKGLSSPGMVSGSSYPNWTATVGVNFHRPIVTGFYIALYSLPLTFPAMLRLRPVQRWRALWVAVLGGVGAIHFMSTLLQPGPFNSLVGSMSQMPRVQSLFFGLIVGATIYNFVAVIVLLWEQRTSLFSCPPVVFSILVIVFFVAEQLGIQGNIPFYDRYVIQVAPFLGIIAFALVPQVNLTRLLALGAMSVLGHGMLWRYALGG